MKFSAYEEVFQEILNSPAPQPPYDHAAYLDYAKLNWSRQQRWLKTGVLSNEVVAAVKTIAAPQQWIVLTEPWCGDAAHIVPFLQMIAALNPLISIDYQLRDSPPFLINSYLTGTSKSIPKLVIRDAAGADLAVWGPRPAGCQEVYNRLIAEKADFEQTKIALQKWYNEDKGKSLQEELLPLLVSTVPAG